MFETTNQYADHVDKASKIIQGKKCPFVSYKSSEDGCDPDSGSRTRLWQILQFQYINPIASVFPKKNMSYPLVI